MGMNLINFPYCQVCPSDGNIDVYIPALTWRRGERRGGRGGMRRREGEGKKEERSREEGKRKEGIEGKVREGKDKIINIERREGREGKIWVKGSDGYREGE